MVTQTERIPASAAARHATGTTSDTCVLTNVKISPGDFTKQKFQDKLTLGGEIVCKQKLVPRNQL